jgi:hypothetical protein
VVRFGSIKKIANQNKAAITKLCTYLRRRKRRPSLLHQRGAGEEEDDCDFYLGGRGRGRTCLGGGEKDCDCGDGMRKGEKLCLSLLLLLLLLLLSW